MSESLAKALVPPAPRPVLSKDALDALLDRYDTSVAREPEPTNVVPLKAAAAELSNISTQSQQNLVTLEPSQIKAASDEDSVTIEPGHDTTEFDDNPVTIQRGSTITESQQNPAITEPSQTATGSKDNRVTLEPGQSTTELQQNPATAEPGQSTTGFQENRDTIELSHVTTEPIRNPVTTEPSHNRTQSQENPVTVERSHKGTASQQDPAIVQPGRATTQSPKDSVTPKLGRKARAMNDLKTGVNRNRVSSQPSQAATRSKSNSVTATGLRLNRVSSQPAGLDMKSVTEYLIESGGYFPAGNQLIDRWMKVMEPMDFKVYCLLYRQTIGFQRDTVTLGAGAIATMTGLSKSSVKKCLPRLEGMGLIESLGVKQHGDQEGTTYRVFLEPGRSLTELRGDHNIIHDDLDDDSNSKDHHPSAPVEIYQQLTKRNWTKRDDDGFRKLLEEGIDPTTVANLMAEIASAAATPINSFSYFAKSIKQRVSQGANDLRQGYKKILAEMRTSGLYGGASARVFEEAFYDRCIRANLSFDKHLFNEMAGY